ncbi:hypothetical protein LOTGIDRAFT_196232 [Lottia gigantea]|uniref:6-phosphogluconolactonase n=1 Tax=Lottia gigantea TaxID=225164 RepID=V4B8D7_LOTGI|nr:hypothetical protein LOTGIDRAFT_196232 [Lottia gigantea]ESO84989.1 hypothetical protein LOTGIDRAFT_196232 [Lottia gigantea]
MSAPSVQVFDSDTIVADKLCSLVVNRANETIKARGKFFIGVSGGSVAKFLCGGLQKAETDWSKWKIFFCDERHVPFDNPECTYSIYEKNLTSKINFPKENIFPINPELSVSESATDYAQKISKEFETNGVPEFDVLVLGMGPDGHVCSLFPGHPLLDETTKVVAPISDSPKPPPSRVTLTFPVINRCRCAVFASCGAAKADILKKVLEIREEPLLPASRVNPTKGELIWMLDSAAAANLSNVSKM